MLNGSGLASGLVQAPDAGPREVRQLFGMLIAINLALAVAQVVLAPWAAAYYRHPEIAAILRVQALLYLTTPFIAIAYAQLNRAMDFRHQARANIAASMASASTALGGALAGWGVWTLVAAPLVLFTVRAAVLTRGAGTLVRPSFDFRGAGRLARYGGVMAAGQVFWFLQSQTDVFVAGRSFSAHHLGIYTTSLFLAQIFVAKFVPPLNEVAFSAYARLRHDRRAVGGAFVRSVELVMVLALPLYVGLATTAGPLVLTVLGPKWAEAIPVVRLLALAMPAMTLLVLYGPACDAQGKPGIGVGNGAIGAAILAIAFLVGVGWGPVGLAYAWIAAYPLYLIAASARALPVIGVRVGDLARVIAPPAVAALAMAAVVTAIDQALPPLPPLPRLAILVAGGGASYLGWLATLARPTLSAVASAVRAR
jgi:O-antigen/teichoic acid export membrane protein